MKRKFVKLARFIESEKGKFHLCTLDLTACAKKEDGKFVAFFEEFDGYVAGVGNNYNNALDNLIEDFTGLIDFQIERGVYREFLRRHLGDPTFIPIKVPEEQRAAYSKAILPWQLPEHRNASFQ